MYNCRLFYPQFFHDSNPSAFLIFYILEYFHIRFRFHGHMHNCTCAIIRTNTFLKVASNLYCINKWHFWQTNVSNSKIPFSECERLKKMSNYQTAKASLTVKKGQAGSLCTNVKNLSWRHLILHRFNIWKDWDIP